MINSAFKGQKWGENSLSGKEFATSILEFITFLFIVSFNLKLIPFLIFDEQRNPAMIFQLLRRIQPTFSREDKNSTENGKYFISVKLMSLKFSLLIAAFLICLIRLNQSFSFGVPREVSSDLRDLSNVIDNMFPFMSCRKKFGSMLKRLRNTGRNKQNVWISQLWLTWINKLARFLFIQDICRFIEMFSWFQAQEE